MSVHGAIVRGGEATVRKRLFSSHGDAQRLEFAQLGLMAQAELVLQDGRASVAIPVRPGIVEVDAQAFFPNWRATERRRSSTDAPVRSKFSSVRFDSADK